MLNPQNDPPVQMNHVCQPAIWSPGRRALRDELEASHRWIASLPRRSPRHNRPAFRAPERVQDEVSYELDGRRYFAGPFRTRHEQAEALARAKAEGATDARLCSSETQREHAIRVEAAKRKFDAARRANAEKRGTWGPNCWRVYREVPEQRPGEQVGDPIVTENR